MQSPPAATSPPTARELIAKPRPLVIAHRGDSKAGPENTLPAFAGAVRVGADMVEFDYLHSADGVPMVFHDTELDRTTNAGELWGQGVRLATKTLAELRQLDAGSWFDRKYSGTPIPTLGEAINVISAGSVAVIERKTGDAATCIEVLESKQCVERVVLQAFDWDFLAECHRRCPALAIVALGQKDLAPTQLDRIEAIGALGVGWENESTNEALIKAVHQRGLKLWVWTADAPDRIRQLASWGANGIITNIPRTSLEVLRVATTSM